MSFNIALSGIRASQKDLDVTANNISNVNTYGFKESRAEFADVYASSVFSNTKTLVGNGVKTSHVAQQFQQGSMLFTENGLDLAINGEGFFVTSEASTGSLERSYTRAGAFKLDKDNFVVNSAGQFLQVYSTNENTGTPTAISMAATESLQIPDREGSPVMTSQIDMAFNLESTKASIPTTTAFDPTDPNTYSSATSVTIYDSLGEPHIVSTYFIKRPADPVGPPVVPDRAWDMEVRVDGQTPNGYTATQVTFDNAGMLSSPAAGSVATNLDLSNVITNGADNTQAIDIRFSAATQYAAPFSVSELKQDGSTVGRLTGIDIGADGLVRASYSNGVNKYLGKVALARFANQQGLKQVGETAWKQTQVSGEALAGEPSVGTFGSINASALEQSNVNLTNELVDLITAQRNFQANSRALETNSQLQQTILQIR